MTWDLIVFCEDSADLWIYLLYIFCPLVYGLGYTKVSLIFCKLHLFSFHFTLLLMNICSITHIVRFSIHDFLVLFLTYFFNSVFHIYFSQNLKELRYSWMMSSLFYYKYRMLLEYTVKTNTISMFMADIKLIQLLTLTFLCRL